MQRSSLMPFFWSRLFAPAFLAGAVASGCAAGGGSLEGEGTDTQFETSSPPGTITPSLPNAAPPGAPPAQNQSNTAGNTAQTPVIPAAPSEPVPENAAGNDGNSEVLPTPERDESAVPPANPGGDDGGNQAGDDDDDDDGDDDDRDDDDGDDRDDDDDDGDDDDGDDDDGDDDDGDDDDDGAGVDPPPNPNPNPVTPAPNDLTFTADIRPILVTECGRCHASGGLPNFASANAATGYDVAFRERNEIIELIQDGEMPADTCNGAPGSNGCVSVADFDRIRQWVAAGAPE
jgi:hypothetical protein